MDDYVTHLEHEEFRRSMNAENQRLRDEDTRQNKRLDSIEQSITEMHNISVAVERLATNMENMCNVQTAQGERLKTLEERDGDNWRTFLKNLGIILLGAIMGVILMKIGLQAA